MAGKGEMIEVEMDTTETGCCGGTGWEKVSMRVNPDGSFTVHEHADQEQGRGPVSKTASSVRYDSNKDVLAVILDGDAREVRIPGKNKSESRRKLKEMEDTYKNSQKQTKAPRARSKPGGSYQSTVQSETNPAAAGEPAESEAGVLWVGTAFLYDKDGDGKIDLTNGSEYKLESVVEPDSNVTFQAADSVAKQILEKHVLGGMWQRLLKDKSIHFKLSAAGSDLQVYCGYKKEWASMCFVLAAVNTEVNACANVTENSGGVLHHESGLLRKHFGKQIKKSGDNNHIRSLFENQSTQVIEQFNSDVLKKVQQVNAINLENIKLEREGDKSLKELKEKLLRNLQTIEDRSIKVLKSKKSAEKQKMALTALHKETKVVADVACWKHCRYIVCVSVIVTIVLTAVVVILYFFLKKK